MNLSRLFWLIAFAVFVVFSSYLVEEIWLSPKQPFPLGSIESQIFEDFINLKKEKSLPPEFKNIHEVFVIDRRATKSPVQWKKLSALLFAKVPNGKYDLQIEVFDSEATGSASAENFIIMEFSLFELPSKNKIFELNRKYSTQSPKL